MYVKLELIIFLCNIGMESNMHIVPLAVQHMPTSKLVIVYLQFVAHMVAVIGISCNNVSSDHILGQNCVYKHIQSSQQEATIV